jgi:hypothetical protein
LNVIESSEKFDDYFYYYRISERRAGPSRIVLHFQPVCWGDSGIIKTLTFLGHLPACRWKNPDKS